MIHLHNTLSSPADPSASGSTKTPASLDRLSSFRNALSEAVSSTLQQFGIDPNQVQVSISPSSTPATPTTPTNSGGTQTTTPYDPFAQAGSNSWVGMPVPAVNSTPTTPANATAATNPQQTFDNNYWAQQPAAVQALRTMPESQRSTYAQQLASEGYSIDVPIMVWGWDPSIVTSMRQADGYTWVPSAMQNPVEVAPGLGAVGNLAAYDPKNPPPGSIAVS